MGTRERLKLVLENVLLIDGVPNAHLAGMVSRGNVEARGRIFGHLYGARVLGIYVAL